MFLGLIDLAVELEAGSLMTLDSLASPVPKCLRSQKGRFLPLTRPGTKPGSPLCWGFSFVLLNSSRSALARHPGFNLPSIPGSAEMLQGGLGWALHPALSLQLWL